ncbi:hypothetical protein [Sorangium cellulosum]|uniref:Uncharacterized protein n=1 Tax=Sorangium cellulosum So0157-2 TaxID=1254432 RepID=S4Y9J9_SORCE|nr:hypothetical protein [Sorangium cellulosum]AGP39463.1 hypothetical protein SCE1572_36250 [Sorangium cellulosum So0157-2]
MSIKGLVVHFQRDLNDHETERMIDAIMMLKGVTKVSALEASYEDHLNRERIKRELLDKIYALLREA